MSKHVVFIGMYNGEQISVANELVKMGYAKKCVIENGDFHIVDYDTSIIESIDIIGILEDRMDDVCDFNEIPPLGREIIEAALPYESMAIKLGLRRTNYPITEYEREKRSYYRMLRYYNYIFESRGITCAYFEMFPHFMATYIPYVVAKIHNLPVVISQLTPIGNMNAYGMDRNLIGENIKEEYLRIKDSITPEECELTGQIKAYYDRKSRSFDEMRAANVNVGRDKASFEERDLMWHLLRWDNYMGKNAWLRPQRIWLRIHLSYLLKYHDKERLAKSMRRYEEIRREAYAIKYHKKYLITWLDDYNKFAEELDTSNKYIYFALHQTPEGSVVPIGGIFSDLYNAIQILAKAAEARGMYVYVKEHFVQAFRETTFYDDLLKIPNLKFLKTTVNTNDVMEHAVAVSTVTGSAILEGALHGIPSLVAGDGYYWKGIPGLHEFNNYDDCLAGIDDIIANPKVDTGEVKKYFYAMEGNLLALDETVTRDKLGESNSKETIDGIVKIITTSVPALD